MNAVEVGPSPPPSPRVRSLLRAKCMGVERELFTPRPAFLGVARKLFTADQTPSPRRWRSLSTVLVVRGEGGGEGYAYGEGTRP